jgi:ABC-type transporter Mla MlaB component
METGIIERPVGEIRPGDHAAFSFTTTEEQEQVIGPFLHGGLDTAEKVIYISDDQPGRLPGMRARADADHLARSGQLRLIPRHLACVTRGHFDPDRMLTVISGEITRAGEQGYGAVRLTADMSWVLQEPGGYPLMLACEARFAEAIAFGGPIMAICQLNRDDCPSDQIRALEGAHQIRVTADPVFDDGVLRLTRTHAPDGLRIAGEVDSAHHAALSAALSSISDRCTDLHLDFAQVSFLDLAALSLLVTYAMRMPPGRALVLDNLPPDVDGVIQTLGWRHFPGLERGRSMRS